LSNFLHGQGYDFEKPDACAVSEKKTLIVEHFQHDCYRRTSKGSKDTAEDKRIDRKFNKFLETGSPSLFHDVIDVKSSYAFFVSRRAFQRNRQRLKY
jgi:hypothetical protein